MIDHDEIPAQAIEIAEESKPPYGRRKVDNSALAKINALISHYKALFMLLVGIGVAFGWDFITPGKRLEELENNQIHISRQLTRQDTINVFNVVISTGVATWVCMNATENEKRLIKLPCTRLLAGESLTVPGATRYDRDWISP